jgi:hypothetical protein
MLAWLLRTMPTSKQNKMLRALVLETLLSELNISPALFSGNKPTTDPIDNKNIAKAISDIERGFNTALLNSMLLMHSDAYDKESREYDDELYEQFRGIAESASQELLSRVNASIHDVWNKAIKSAKPREK